jgi:hypothetical protein
VCVSVLLLGVTLEFTDGLRGVQERITDERLHELYSSMEFGEATRARRGCLFTRCEKQGTGMGGRHGVTRFIGRWAFMHILIERWWIVGHVDRPVYVLFLTSSCLVARDSSTLWVVTLLRNSSLVCTMVSSLLVSVVRTEESAVSGQMPTGDFTLGPDLAKCRLKGTLYWGPAPIWDPT